MSHPSIRSERRRHLAELDNLLAELEFLNLADRCDVPDELATRLEARGVGTPAGKRPPELIEDIFNLQRPFLRPNPTSVGTQAMRTVRRPPVASGWVLV